MTELRARSDRFDEARRAWIAAHQGHSLIQRRRAEQLGRRVRARQRAVAVAVPDPHDDTAIPPLWLRTAKSPAAQLEGLAVLILLIVIPLGWLGGRTLNAVVVRLIPGTLPGYPIVALTSAGAGLGAVVVVCHDPGTAVGSALLTAWWCAQVVSAPAVAGVLGVLDGWLAVAGSSQWWPMTHRQLPLSKADAVEILGGFDLTGPGVVSAQRLNAVGERSAW